MAKKTTKTVKASNINTVSLSKRRITQPGGFNIPGYGVVAEGEEVTDAMRKAHEVWQAKCDGTLNINDYTS